MQVWNSFVWQCKHTKMPIKEVQTNLWFVSNCTYTNWLVTVIDVHTVCKQKIIHVWVTGASQMLCFFLSGNGADVNIQTMSSDVSVPASFPKIDQKARGQDTSARTIVASKCFLRVLHFKYVVTSVLKASLHHMTKIMLLLVGQFSLHCDEKEIEYLYVKQLCCIDGMQKFVFYYQLFI